MIIDAHTHGFHGAHLDPLIDVGGEWVKENITRDMARGKPELFDLSMRLEQLARTEIDLQINTPGMHMDVNRFPGSAGARLNLAKAINDNMARLMEDSKGKLLAAGTIPLGSLEQGGLKEMERAITSLGLTALNLPTNIDGKPLDLPEFEPFWSQAAEMDVPVYIHPVDPIGQTDRSYEAEYDLIHNFGWPFETTLALSRLVFSGIVERYPTLKIVSHHLGGMIPFFWGRINETYSPKNQQERIGRTMSEPLFDNFSRFFYDTAVGGSVSALRCAYEVFGADQIVFATDYPFGEGEGRMRDYPKMIRSLGLSEADNKKIFEDNTRRLFNL